MNARIALAAALLLAPVAGARGQRAPLAAARTPGAAARPSVGASPSDSARAQAPAIRRPARRGPARAVALGALIGAAGGTASGLAVAAACRPYCDRGSRAGGVTVHVLSGAAIGAGIAFAVRALRH
jgi:hypothetical protein